MAYVYDQAAREALFSYSGEIQEQVHLQCIEGKADAVMSWHSLSQMHRFS